MPDPTPTPLQVPDFRNRERYPTRPGHHPQSYRDDLDTLVREMSAREEPPEVPVRPLLDPKLTPQEYEKQFRESVRRLSRR